MDVVHLAIDGDSQSALDVYLMDLNGRVLYVGKWLRFMGKGQEIDLSAYADGGVHIETRLR